MYVCTKRRDENHSLAGFDDDVEPLVNLLLLLLPVAAGVDFLSSSIATLSIILHIVRA
jgi:hypothetical protein